MAEEQGSTPAGGSPAPAEPNIVVTGGPPPEAVPAESEAAQTPPEQETAKADEAEAPSKPTGKDRLQKRFSELTRTIYEERARREAIEREYAELKARAQPAQPSGSEVPKLEDFSDYEAYADAKARFVAQQEIQKLQRSHAEQTARQRATETAAEIRARWETAEAGAKEKFADYDEVMADGSVSFTEAVSLALLDSDSGPEVAYYLKSHPSEAQALRGLSPVAAARAIGKIEAKLTSAPAPKPTTAAPAPPKPLGGTPPAEGLRDDLDTSEWIRRRNKQIIDRRQHG